MTNDQTLPLPLSPLPSASTSGKAMPDLIYVYCVMDRMPVLKTRDRGPGTGDRLPSPVLLDLVAHDGLYALVGRVSAQDFSEENLPARLKDLNWIAEKVKLHERIVEHAMQHGCVIPLKFGTVFSSEDNVHSMLEAHAGEFRRNLAALAGKEEWGVKVYCDRQRLADDVRARDPRMIDLERQIAAAPKGRAFLLGKRRADTLSAAVDATIASLSQEIFDRLTKQSVRSRINPPLPAEVTGRKEEMILNSASLVLRESVPSFLDAADSLKESLGSRGALIECTGPWPPYNFCEFGPESA